jgi:hypothetical protein
MNKVSTPLVTVLICSGISVFLVNSGFLSLFFLVPLGYAILVTGALWQTFVAAAVIHFVTSLFMRVVSGHTYGSFWVEILYFAVMFTGFIWIMSGNRLTNIRTAFRFILAAAAGTFVFYIFILNDRSNFGFNILFNDIAAVFSSILSSSPGDDVLRRSLFQDTVTPERVLEVMKSILMRGGALSSFLFLFFINRHLTYKAMQLIKKQKEEQGLVGFFAPQQTIWVFSASLATILLTRMFTVGFFEILAWNVFVVCGIIFMAQGAGILMHLLAKRTPGFRLFVNVLIVLLIFSPLSTIAVTAVLLLGVMENWLPLRGPKMASTPEP